MKKFPGFLFLTVIFLILSFAGCSQPEDKNSSSSGAQTVNQEDSLIFFYGRECPHCQNVEEFFVREKVTEKINFSQAEVYHNKENAEIMKKKAEICRLDLDNLGVPMLFAEGQCLLGDKPIIAYFEEKLKK